MLCVVMLTVLNAHSQSKLCSLLKLEFDTTNLETDKQVVLKITCTSGSEKYVDTFKFSSTTTIKEVTIPKGKFSVKIESDHFTEYVITEVVAKCNHMEFFEIILENKKKGSKKTKK